MGMGLHPRGVTHLQWQEGQGVFDQQPHQALGVEDKFISGRVLVPGRGDTCEVGTEALQSTREAPEANQRGQQSHLWEPERSWSDTVSDHQRCGAH